MKKANLSRFKGCMKRAQLGEELTIGFLGGSITQGSLAAEHENTYAYRVYSWWKEAFPQARFHYVNGGIGGTTSHYGVSRAVTDVLMYQPDIVVVDFSVNDESDPFFQETYEGVIRRLLTWDSHPAVVLLNNVFYDTGVNAQEYHNAVGDWYQVPHVSIRDTVWQRMKAGEYERADLTPDGLHPNDKGHGLVAGEIIAFLEDVKAHLEETEEENLLPEAMTENAYEHAKRLTIREISPVLDGFRADTEEKMGHLDHFKNGWIGKRSGDKITFEIEATCIAVQYRKTICRPAVRAKLVLDGDEENGILLDGNFDEDWGDCLYLETVLHHGIPQGHPIMHDLAGRADFVRQSMEKKHKIEITVLEDEIKDAAPFYLMALVVA